jgi:hypothetical protein
VSASVLLVQLESTMNDELKGGCAGEMDDAACCALEAIRNALRGHADQVNELWAVWHLLPTDVKAPLHLPLKGLADGLENLWRLEILDTQAFALIDEVMEQVQTSVKWVPTTTPTAAA